MPPDPIRDPSSSRSIRATPTVPVASERAPARTPPHAIARDAGAQLAAVSVTESPPRRVVLVGGDRESATRTANELAEAQQRPLHRVDLAQIDASTLAETERALERIFAEAEASGAVLYFDEADSLFGERTDGNGPVREEVVAVLRHQLDRYTGPIVLTSTSAPSAEQAAAGQFDAVIAVEAGARWQDAVAGTTRSPSSERNWHLLRTLLLRAEEVRNNAPSHATPIPGFAPETVLAHTIMLLDQGWLRGSLYRSGSGESSAIVEGLSWSGHDVVALLHDEARWARAQASVVDASGRADTTRLLEWLRAEQRTAR